MTDPACLKTCVHDLALVQRGLGFDVPVHLFADNPTEEQKRRWADEQEAAVRAYREHLKNAAVCLGCGESPTLFVCSHCHGHYCSKECAARRK